MTKCEGIQVFPINPPVVRCACGVKVVVRKEGDWKRHLSGENPGEPFPWAEPSE